MNRACKLLFKQSVRLDNEMRSLKFSGNWGRGEIFCLIIE